MYQPPAGGNGWGGVQHAHQRIDKLAEELGDMRSDVATIKADMLTEEKFRALMDWGPRREEQQWRGRQDERFQQWQNYPIERREERGLHYQAEQTRSYQTQNLLIGLTLILSVVSLVATFLK